MIVGIKLNENGKTYYFNSNGYNLKDGDSVIVETEKGQQFGTVATTVVDESLNKNLELKNVIRTGWVDWKVNRDRVESIAEHIFGETDCIINLASKEYSICVSKYLHPGIRFITCVFGEEKDGKIIEKGTMCKMARGEMVRYMAEQQITKPEEIRAFDRLDYAFDPERSDESTYVFVKRGKAPCSLD